MKEKNEAKYTIYMTRARRSIVIIEDDASQQKALRLALEKEGFEVHAAMNGKEGIELVHVQKPDIIFCDVIMPVMTGIEALEHFRADALIRDIPVFVLTNYALHEKVMPLLDLKKDRFFLKTDSSLKQIIAEINTILS